MVLMLPAVMLAVTLKPVGVNVATLPTPDTLTTILLSALLITTLLLPLLTMPERCTCPQIAELPL